jgi:hypothetical protein
MGFKYQIIGFDSFEKKSSITYEVIVFFKVLE